MILRAIQVVIPDEQYLSPGKQKRCKKTCVSPAAIDKNQITMLPMLSNNFQGVKGACRKFCILLLAIGKLPSNSGTPQAAVWPISR